MKKMKKEVGSPSQELASCLAVELKQLYPDMKQYLSERYAFKYVSELLPLIGYALTFKPNEMYPDRFHFSRVAIRTAVSDNRASSLMGLMDCSPRTRIINFVHTGFTGVMSTAVLNPIYKELVMQALETTTITLGRKEREDIQRNWTHRIPVDANSLMNYIEQTQRDLKNSTSNSLDRHLDRNLLAARTLMEQLEEDEQGIHVKEVWSTKDSGRQYGKYNSLQTRPKNVRHAALGKCHRYDFKACAFSIMLSLAHQIDPSIKIESIRDYIKNRTKIRNKIAAETNCRPDDIKQVFTALGFGAKVVDNGFKAIRKVFGKRADDYQRLVNNQTFQWINEDLQAVNRVILAQFPADEFELAGRQYTKTYQKGDKTAERNDNQKLAWIYQCFEAEALAQFVSLVEQLSGLKPLLEVHDCVYYSNPVPADAKNSAVIFLRDNLQYIDIEGEDVFPITTDEAFNSRFDDQVRDEQDHRALIAQQEQLARGYQSNYQSVKFNQQTEMSEVDWLITRHRIETTPDRPDYEYDYDLPDLRK